MVPLAACSVAALGICLERLWTLSARRVAPRELVEAVERGFGEIDLDRLRVNCPGSHLGTIFLAGIASARRGRVAMKEAMEQVAGTVVHEMERYLTALGTIASISPLLGLLGTVVGMIEVFRALVADGIGRPAVFAAGISEALITTAAGLAVAIPALIMHRYLLRRVDDLLVTMERASARLVDRIDPPGETAP